MFTFILTRYSIPSFYGCILDQVVYFGDKQRCQIYIEGEIYKLTSRILQLAMW